MRLTILFAALCAIAACKDFPKLDSVAGSGTAAVPYPALAPLDRLLGDDAPPRATAAEADALRARANALRARANALRRQAPQ